MAEELRELVRRVVGRVLAERGLGAEPSARPSRGGVHVQVEPPSGPARPSEESVAGGQALPDLVTERCLAAHPDGARIALAPGAKVTPLAREEARRRGIELGVELPAARALRVAVGSDHGGFSRKAEVLRWLGELGQRAFDLGTRDESPVDYPDFAAAVALEVAEGRADLGVCIDGAGLGSAIAANKVPGVRAATCWDEASARNAREHNFANVLALGARNLDSATAEKVLRAFLATAEGEERHQRRVEKIAELERRATGRAHPVRRVRPRAVEGGGAGR